MFRLRAFRPTNERIVKVQVHPTHPWLVTADASDHVSVWNWEHRQFIYELKAGGIDERRLVGAKLEKLAEGETGVVVGFDNHLSWVGGNFFNRLNLPRVPIICEVPHRFHAISTSMSRLCYRSKGQDAQYQFDYAICIFEYNEERKLKPLLHRHESQVRRVVWELGASSRSTA